MFKRTMARDARCILENFSMFRFKGPPLPLSVMAWGEVLLPSTIKLEVDIDMNKLLA